MPKSRESSNGLLNNKKAIKGRLINVFSKHLKEFCLENINYATGYIDGEENLNWFLKEFEAVAHISYSTAKF